MAWGSGTGLWVGPSRRIVAPWAMAMSNGVRSNGGRSNAFKPNPSKPAVLLVDGYNIIGTCPRLQGLRDRQGLDEARRSLIELLVNYSASLAYETELVFDAQYLDVPGTREKVTDSLHLCFTDFGQTADTYIERACALFFREDLRRFEYRMIVATSDRAQWITAVGYGAEWMSSQKLLGEAIAQAEQTQRHRRDSDRQSKKRFLGNSLDRDVQSRLNRLKHDLLKRGI